MPRTTELRRLSTRTAVGISWILSMSLSAAAFAAPPAQAAMPGSPPLVIAQALPDNPARISPQEKEDDEREVLVIQALDQPTDLSVRDTPIGDAIKQLVEKTGIETVIAQETFALLPHGAQTRLSSSFQNKPLREGLNALLLPLGLQYTPTSRGLVIEPSAPLLRIARRSAWEEVETLALLRHRPWSDQLFDSLSFQFQDTAGGDLEDHRKTLKRLADAVGVGNAAEVLELACEQYGWTWYPNGDKIVILSKARQIERQLDQRVDLRYDQVSLKDVLLDLARRANVLLRMDGGVLTTLPQQGNDRFLLNVQNTTIRQVFDLVAGQTGVSYIIEPDGVRLTVGVAMPTSTSVGSDLARAASEAYRLNPIVGQITFQSDDGASYSFFLRENDFPPEINELRKLRMRQSVVELGHSLKAEQPRD